VWVAVFDFCLIVLLFSFLLFGLREWNNLLVDENESPAPPTSSAVENRRLRPIWVLLIGLGSLAVLADLAEWLNSWTL
jgi:hypothetical protein